MHSVRVIAVLSQLVTMLCLVCAQRPHIPINSGFTCADGMVLGWESFCNGIVNCPVDGRDEIFCNPIHVCDARAGFLRCESNLKCVPPTSVCNGHCECPFCEDERLCATTAQEIHHCGACLPVAHLLYQIKYVQNLQPVVITDETTNWTAHQNFDLSFFASLYQSPSNQVYHQRNCQFFPYKTHFKSLAHALNQLMNNSTARNQKWYIGWSNCDVFIANQLRSHYKRPSFLPSDSAGLRTDWLFMGTPGYGAHNHIDNVRYPSWQAQIKGRKVWILRPAYECRFQCQNIIKVVVEPGEIIVLDTNRWYHQTEIIGNDISITIGAEFD